MIAPSATLFAPFLLWASAPGDSAYWGAEVDGALRDFDEGQQVLQQQPDRARQLFRSAARRLENVAAAVENGYLEYNLGNCYLHAGDVGRAILHYRRAQRFIPRDTLLADNLALARSRCLTQIQPARRQAVMRSLFFWHYRTSEAERAYAGVTSYVIAFGFLTAGALARRRWLAVAAAVSLAVALLAGGSVATGRWSQRNDPAAVITAMDVAVYKGPGPGYQRQFEQPLQPGVECVVQEQRDRWWRVELPDGNTGWIEAASAELIDTQPNERAVFLR